MSTETMKTGSKVAQATLAFWIMKTCATTVGETGGDMLSMTLDVGYAVSSLILVSFFLVTLVLQLRSKAFHPALYWCVILSTSTAGTTISDFLDRSAGMGYAAGSAMLVMLLAMVLLAWRLTIGKLSVDHITDPRVEIFYWSAILVSNTLGTALGDYLADSSGLGYGLSNLLISSALGAIVLAYFLTKIPRTILFWSAFILTRPFGATMGDLLTKAPAKGGLGFGTIGSSVVLLGILAALIALTGRRDRSAQPA